MPAFHVERSIVIDVPIKMVRDNLKNFKNWSYWSPWIVMEPDVTLTYSDRQGQVGANHGWSDVLIGAGSMELMSVQDKTLKMHLNFLKPFKSRANTGFDFAAVGEATKVTWFMDGALPFFMFWMTSKMKTLIGMDYERGLLMLKEYLETGNVASYVHIEGVIPMKEQKYIGIPRTCAIKEIGEVMKKDFETLSEFMKENNLPESRIPFSIYNTFDIFKENTSYVACIPFDEDVAVGNSWVRGTLPERDALKTMHKGRYLHLGNGWTTAMNFARLKKMKLMGSPVGYEFYLNNPIDTDEAELITEIYLPLK